MLADILKAPGQVLTLPLTDMEAGRQLPGCTVTLKAEPLSPADNRVVSF